MTQLLQLPKKFLLYAILALNSLMVFIEVLHKLNALLLIYLKPSHQLIKDTTQSSPRAWGVHHKDLQNIVYLMVILGEEFYCLNLISVSSQLDH